MELREHQIDAIEQLKAGKKFIVCGTGLGKTAMMLYWLKSTGKKKWLMVTSAAKAKTPDFANECDAWFGKKYRESLSSFSVLSWALLRGTKKNPNWFKAHRNELDEWAIAFDEVHSAKAGISSSQGTQFLNITMHTNCWTGYTATPAEDWLDYYPYFTACGHIRNKTEFNRRFCIIQTFRGFPDYVGWKDEETMIDWWADDSYAPDDSKALAQLPKENNKVEHFKKPTGYDKVDKTCYDLDGNFIETNSAFRHYLRKMCASKEKMEWLKDFLTGLQSGCVIFYNYISEGDELEAVAKKARTGRKKRQLGKVWRIDGRHHDIPTAETFGERDVVLAQWQSGSASLNLQFINYWVCFTPYDSYITSIQAKGRIKRIGQTKPMFFYFLQCDGTVEEDIYEALHNKKNFDKYAWMFKRKAERKVLPEDKE